MSEIPMPFRGYSENSSYARSPLDITLNAQNVVPFDPSEHRSRIGQRAGTDPYVDATIDSTQRINIGGAGYTHSTKVLNLTGGFSSYTHTTGDAFRVTGEDGTTNFTVGGSHIIASKTDDDNIVLETSPGADGTNVAGYIVSQSGGSANRVQDINQIVRVIDPRSIEQDSEVVSIPFNGTANADVDDDTTWNEYTHRSNSPNAGAFEAAVSSDWLWEYDSTGTKAEGDATQLSDANSARCGLLYVPGTGYDDTASYIVRVKLTTFAGGQTADNSRYRAGIAFRVDESSDEYFGAVWQRKTADATKYTIGIIKGNNGGNTTQLATTAEGTTDSNEHDLELRVNKHFVEVYWDGVKQTWATGAGSGLIKGAKWYDLSADGYDASANDGVGLLYSRIRDDAASNNWGGDDSVLFDDFEIWTGKAVTTFAEPQVIVVTGGNFHYGTKTGGFTVPTGGYGYFSKNENYVETFEAFGKLYGVDGTNLVQYDPDIRQVTVWTKTSGTTRSIPGDDNDDGIGEVARYAALWQGRAVLAGFLNDPRNWHMSAQGDVSNWEWAGGADTAGAVSGTGDHSFGETPDIITAIIPYTDNSIIFGCERSITVINGNPADFANAEMRSLSRDVGVFGPRAWCVGANKVIYIYGTNGLYQISPNQFNINQNDRITAGRLDKSMAEIDAESYTVELAWDIYRHGVWMFVIPIESTTAVTTSYFFDQRSNSIWPVKFANVNHGPTAVHVYDSDAQGDRAILLGGFDSKVRYLLDTATDDDGTAIDSYVFFGPMNSQRQREMKLVDTRIVMDENITTSNTDFSVHVGDTAEGALAASATFTTSDLVAGRNAAIKSRARGAHLFAKVRNSTAASWWALEELDMKLVEAGQTRSR